MQVLFDVSERERTVAFLCLSMPTPEDLKRQNMSTSKHYLRIKIAIDFGLFAKHFFKSFAAIWTNFQALKKLQKNYYNKPPSCIEETTTISFL